MADIPTISIAPSIVINKYYEALHVLFLTVKSCAPSTPQDFWNHVFIFWNKGGELKKIPFRVVVKLVEKNEKWFAEFGNAFFKCLEKESETFKNRIKLNFHELSIMLAALHFNSIEDEQVRTFCYEGEKEGNSFIEQGMVFKVISEVQNTLLELLLVDKDPVGDQQFYFSFLINFICLIHYVSKHPVVKKLFSCLYFWGPYFSLERLIHVKRENAAWNEIVLAYDTLFSYLKRLSVVTPLSEAIKEINIHAATSYQLYLMESHVGLLPFQFEPPLQENSTQSPLLALWLSNLEFPIPIQSSECFEKVVLSTQNSNLNSEWFYEFGKTLLLEIGKMAGDPGTDFSNEKLQTDMKNFSTLTDESLYRACQPLDYFQTRSPLKSKEQVVTKIKEGNQKKVNSLHFFFGYLMFCVFF